MLLLNLGSKVQSKQKHHKHPQTCMLYWLPNLGRSLTYLLPLTATDMSILVSLQENAVVRCYFYDQISKSTIILANRCENVARTQEDATRIPGCRGNASLCCELFLAARSCQKLSGRSNCLNISILKLSPCSSLDRCLNCGWPGIRISR